ncbi:MAG: signal peptide peptidase SppA [Devosia sp.]
MSTDPIIDPSHAIPAASVLRRSRMRWRLVAFIALVIAILALFGRFATEQGWGERDSIASIRIDGAITTDPARLDLIETLADNDHVKAVIVGINSPGGTTAGGEEIYEALGRLRAKKPVVAVIDELGASAAYMSAIAADRIVARRLSIVGSIGVLVQTTDASKLMQTIGIDLDKVASGPLKAEPDLDEPMSPAVRASLQSLVDDSFNWFVDIVAERRGIDRATVLTLADGRILTGNQGLASKLVDQLGGEREAIEWLESDKGIAKDLEIVQWAPRNDEGWLGFVRRLAGEARSALGLPAGAIALDGLVSLWQVDPAL